MNLLRRLLGGATLAELALECALSANALRKRVLRVARRLQQVVGVVGVEEGATVTMATLRRHRAAYVEALNHFQPASLPNGRERPATDQELELLLEHINRRSGHPARDRALLLLLFGSGARSGELARLTVADYLAPDGTVRHCSSMPERACCNHQARPLYFTSVRLVAALDAHLRLRGAQSGGARMPYRGMDPGAPLIELSGADRAEALSEALRVIFGYLNRPGLNTRAARRRLAIKLYCQGVPRARIAEVLGIKRARAIAHLFPPAPDLGTAIGALA